MLTKIQTAKGLVKMVRLKVNLHNFQRYNKNTDNIILNIIVIITEVDACPVKKEWKYG
jgi:hypothetical protein